MQWKFPQRVYSNEDLDQTDFGFVNKIAYEIRWKSSARVICIFMDVSLDRVLLEINSSLLSDEAGNIWNNTKDLVVH